MAFCGNYKSGLSHYDLNRYEEKVKLCGVDPYELTVGDCVNDMSLWPKITEVDRLDYFVYQTNFPTKEAMKCLKSLEAHNFFTIGLVFRPVVTEVSTELVLVLGKVKHSQAHTQDPLKVWLSAKKGGEIITGHCTCMAGRGEACSHFAAIVFALEYATKAGQDVVGTNVLNAWLPPSISKTGFTDTKRKISEMDFTSPAGKLVKMNKSAVPDEPEDIPSFIANATPMAQAAVNALYEAIAKVKPQAVVLSAIQEHHDPFVPPTVSDELPKLMSALYEEDSSELSYEELLVRCQVVIKDICATNEQVKKIEGLTKKQASSDLWFKFRQGRITASNMKLVCQGDINNPARSTVNKICYGSKTFYSADVQRGKKLERTAKKTYTSIQASSHQDFSVTDCGLYLCQDKAYLAASPDGIVMCSCCEGPGCLEIKCPREENMEALMEMADSSESTNTIIRFKHKCMSVILSTVIFFCSTGSGVFSKELFLISTAMKN